MKATDLRIAGYPLSSAHARPNDLTAAAIRAYTESMRVANEKIRNAKRRHAWAERWRRRFGCYPESFRPDDIIRQTQEALRSLANHPKPEPAAPAACELLVHPRFFRRMRPGNGSQGLVRSPRRRAQYKGTRFPQPPEAA
jgi:hypothetical protein